MAKTIFSGVWKIGRMTALILGLAVMLAMVVGVASQAFGANGDPWKLGRNNIATALTSLGGPAGVNGPMVRLNNQNAGTDDTALELRVQSGEAPMIVNSSTAVQGLNADQVDGRSASTFASSTRYTRESPIDAGTALGDGTFSASKACDAGDIALSGGPANVNPTSTLLESFPEPGNINAWKARINKNGQTDNWNVVGLCADQ